VPRTRNTSRSEPETRAEPTRAEERRAARPADARADRAPSKKSREISARDATARESSRKRSAARWKAARQVALMLGILGCVFAVVALASYDAGDPSFSRRGGGAIQNLAGPAGAWLADVLLQLLGYGAWAVVVLGVQLGRKLAGRALGGLSAAAGWTVASWSGLTVLSLVLGSAEGAPFPAGGLVGMVSSQVLTASFGPVGAWVVVLGALLVAAPFAFGCLTYRTA
jgi:hypothetical protein